MTPIAVIDTGICNLRSVTKALEAVGAAQLGARVEQCALRLDHFAAAGFGSLQGQRAGLDGQVAHDARDQCQQLGAAHRIDRMHEQPHGGSSCQRQQQLSPPPAVGGERQPRVAGLPRLPC